MKKIGKMNEVAWLMGNILCALGVALSTKANFGLSMIAAPPYILHVVISKYLPWYSQGVSQYLSQFIILLIICITVKKFKLRYLLSFVTVIVFGAFIDIWLFIFGGSAPFESMVLRIAMFVLGMIVTALSIAFYFRSSLAPQVAECLVVEFSKKFNTPTEKVKYINDIVFALVSILLSLVLTKGFTGIGIGTVVLAICNAPIIKLWGKLLDKMFGFDSAFSFKKAED